METSHAYIGDVHTLEVLDGKINATGKAMANIDRNVISHLNDVEQILRRQLDYIHTRLLQAETRFRNAEIALAACIASQYVNKFGVLVPSCSCEKREFSEAQIELEKWRERYAQGKQIFNECLQEISDYNAGGHTLISNMSEQQTPKASQILCEHIERLQDVLASNMVANTQLKTENAPEGLNTPHHNKQRANDIKKKFNL